MTYTKTKLGHKARINYPFKRTISLSKDLDIQILRIISIWLIIDLFHKTIRRLLVRQGTIQSKDNQQCFNSRFCCDFARDFPTTKISKTRFVRNHGGIYTNYHLSRYSEELQRTFAWKVVFSAQGRINLCLLLHVIHLIFIGITIFFNCRLS